MNIIKNELINTVTLGDCIEVMKNIPDGSVDLVLSDPPYLMNYQSGRRKEKFNKIANDTNSDENVDLIKNYLFESHRILKDNTHIYIFCSWHNVDMFLNEVKKLFKVKNLLVWNKNNHGSGDLKGAYAPKYELCIYAHKGRRFLNGKRIPDVLNFDKISSLQMIHPTEKPTDLLELLITKSSNEQDIVFDGFAGSASAGIACMNTNRNFILIEKEKEWYEIANKRINEALKIKNT